MTDPTSVVTKPYMFAPQALGMLALGGVWTIGFFENKARDSLHSPEAKLQSWADSFSINAKLFPALGMLTSGLGYWAFKKTEQKDYLYGAITMFSLLPITLLLIKQTNDRLNALNKKAIVNKEGLAKN